MIRKTGIVLGLVAVLALSACAGDPPTEEIIESMIEAMRAVDSYQYEGSLTFEGSGEEAGEPIVSSMAMDISGSLDLAGRQMQADFVVEASISGEDPDIQEIELAIYLVDDVMYMHTQIPLLGNMSMWLKSDVPEGYWDAANTIEPQLELVETAQVTLIGSEKVGSVDCYVLELVPDMEQLWEAMMAQGQAAGESAWPEMPIGEDMLEVDSFSARQWVAKDTFYLMKAEMTMAMSAPLGTTGVSGAVSDVDVEMSVSMTMHDYNRPVSIELPEEAEDAIDFATFGESFGGFLDEGDAEAQETELANVQAAVTTMMVVNELAVLPNPVTVPTDDMTMFPDTSTIDSGDKAVDVYGDAFASGDEDGYVLYMHDETADDDWFSTVDYVATWFTTYWYTVDENGTVTQHLSPEW